MAVLMVAVVALAIVALLGLVLHYTWQRLSSSPSKALEELGVREVYTRTCLPRIKIKGYGEIKEKLRSQHGTAKLTDDEEEGDLWMAKLPVQAKDMLKYSLMQRAIGDMAALRKIDEDARGYWRLFSKGIVSKKFWDSVMEAERSLSAELEAVKYEASQVEPTQDPQGLISEAMQFVLRYGDKLPSSQEMADDADALENLMKQLQPPAGPPGGPPRMPHPGMAMMPPGARPPMPLGAMPPGGMPPGARPNIEPPSGKGEDYSWKQDADEVEVSVEVPATVTKAQVKVSFLPKGIKVEQNGTVVVQGQLVAQYRPEGSTWTLSKGRIIVSLEKAQAGMTWTQLFLPK